MRLVVNDFKHNVNDPALSIDRRGLLTDGGVVYGIENTWIITGRLEGADQAAISTAINKLEAEYNQKINRIALQLDSGDDSSHVLEASRTLGGIRVTQPPHFPVGIGAEYSTFRNYQIVIQAVVPVEQPGVQIVQFTETVTFRGGGTRDVILTPLIGSPQRFQTAQATPALATQQGTLLSLRFRILNVSPLWPRLEFQNLRTMSFGDPQLKQFGGADFLYPTSWRFEFGHVQPIGLRGPQTIGA